MNKTYQPFIVDMANQYVDTLTYDIKFFEEENITNTEYSKLLFCEKLTEKFVDGKITSDDTIKGIFTDVEFTAILNQIMTKNTLDSLVNKGLVNYFEDENGEELFFLTEDGKNIAKQTLQVSGDTNNILNK